MDDAKRKNWKRETEKKGKKKAESRRSGGGSSTRQDGMGCIRQVLGVRGREIRPRVVTSASATATYARKGRRDAGVSLGRRNTKTFGNNKGEERKRKEWKHLCKAQQGDGNQQVLTPELK